MPYKIQQPLDESLYDRDLHKITKIANRLYALPYKQWTLNLISLSSTIVIISLIIMYLG